MSGDPQKSEKLELILDTINDLMLDDRKDILYMIYNSPLRDKLREKGNGSQIKISDLTTTMIDKIHEKIIEKSKNNTISI